MSSQPLPPSDPPPSRSQLLLGGRWGLLLLLLPLELIALSVRFDTASLDERAPAWAGVLAQARHLPQAGVAVVATFVVFGGRRLWREVRGFHEHPETASGSWWGLAVHILGFLGFWVVTGQLLEGGALDGSGAVGWVVGWLLLGLAALGGWAWALLRWREWRRLLATLWLPLAGALLVGGAAWWAGRFTDQLWGSLRGVTFQMVERLLSLVNRDVVSQPDKAVIGLDGFLVEISPECSGYEGMGLIWVFLGAYLVLFRKGLRFPHALLLLPLGTVIVYLANAIRIALLVLIGAYYSEAVAEGGFHSQAGWLAFNGIALGLVLLTRRLRFFSVEQDSPTAAEEEPPPTAAFLSPLLVLVATTMLTSALSAGVDWLYPLRVIAVGAVLWWYRREVRSLGWSWSWQAPLIGVGVFVLWLGLGLWFRPADSEPHPVPAALVQQHPLLTGAWLVFRVAGYVITVPLAEEMGFRGYLLRRVQARDFHRVPATRFTWWSFLISSLVFGVQHGRFVVAGTLAGMAYAWAMHRRGSVADAVIAHAATNGLLAVAVLVTGDWTLWG